MHYRGRTGEPNHSVGMKLPSSLYQVIKAIADEKRMSLSYVLEELIRLGLETCEEPVSLKTTPYTGAPDHED
jgi:hypothetical protein